MEILVAFILWVIIPTLCNNLEIKKVKKSVDKATKLCYNKCIKKKRGKQNVQIR
jgi:hypothetical protein